VYLLGSIHVGKKAMYPLPSAIERAFERSDALVVEVRLDTMATLKSAKILADARYPSGDSLKNHVDEKTWTLLAKQPPLPLGVLERMHPWTVSLTVLAADLQRAGFDPSAGIDKHFMDEADQRSKPIVGIETVEDQLGLLGGRPTINRRRCCARRSKRVGRSASRSKSSRPPGGRATKRAWNRSCGRTGASPSTSRSTRRCSPIETS
jgi:uncharacterized protein YbaP (TraB family)